MLSTKRTPNFDDWKAYKKYRNTRGSIIGACNYMVGVCIGLYLSRDIDTKVTCVLIAGMMFVLFFAHEVVTYEVRKLVDNYLND